MRYRFCTDCQISGTRCSHKSCTPIMQLWFCLFLPKLKLPSPSLLHGSYVAVVAVNCSCRNMVSVLQSLGNPWLPWHLCYTACTGCVLWFMSLGSCSSASLQLHSSAAQRRKRERGRLHRQDQGKTAVCNQKARGKQEHRSLHRATERQVQAPMHRCTQNPSNL
jgi:hypothetical protein